MNRTLGLIILIGISLLIKYLFPYLDQNELSWIKWILYISIIPVAIQSIFMVFYDHHIFHFPTEKESDEKIPLIAAIIIGTLILGTVWFSTKVIEQSVDKYLTRKTITLDTLCWDDPNNKENWICDEVSIPKTNFTRTVESESPTWTK